jgi:hypothetical protein
MVKYVNDIFKLKIIMEHVESKNKKKKREMVCFWISKSNIDQWIN